MKSSGLFSGFYCTFAAVEGLIPITGVNKIFINILSILLVLISFGQISAREMNRTDSLTRELYAENDPQKKMDILMALSKSTFLSNPDSSVYYANQTIKLAIEFDNPKNKLIAWLQLGNIYWNKSDYRSSLEYGNMANALALDLDLDEEYAESLILIARNFSNLGDFKKSAVLNFQALGIFENLGDRKGIREAFHRIGVDYHEQGFFDKALEYHTKALEISREIKNLAGISRGLNNVAVSYASMGETLLAKDKYRESIEINKILDRQLRIGIAYSNLASIYREEEKYDSAFYYLNRASLIYTQLNKLQVLPEIYYGYSLYYKDIGKLDSSLYYAKRYYQISTENKQKNKSHEAAKQLAKLYYEQNDFENAYIYSTIKSQLKDSLDTEVSIARISHLELLHEYEKIEQENKITQQRREFILILVGAGIVFLLLALVVTIIIRNRLKSKNEQIERHRLNLELDSRNKELTANVMTLIKKNEVISGIGDKLLTIRDNAVKTETKSAIKKISNELQKSTDDEIWNEFDIRFRQVHGEFYDRLIKQFPDLAPNELKICAFLRLNMATKDISELTGQQIISIERARTRLRRKLGLANTSANLVSFLAQI